jgi:N6-L-threonylcarbamoyladenine synthase
MAHQKGGAVHYPPLELCTDNGVMIAFAGTLRLLQKESNTPNLKGSFDIKPRWDLSEHPAN